MKARLFFLMIASLVFSLAVHSQDKTKRDKSIVVEANLSVLDSAGKTVDDLKSENLKIFEDGVEQKVEAVERKGDGLTLIIAVDNSNSLKYLIDRLEQSAKVITSDLQPSDEVLAIRFVSSEKIEVLEEFTNDKQKLLNAFGTGMYAEGGASAVIDAVYLSMERLIEREKSNPTRRHALIVLSDFEDKSSFYNSRQLFDLAIRSDAQIFPLKFPGVGLTTKANALTEKLAYELALNSGGTAHMLGQRSVESDLLARLSEIITELRWPYVIRYRSSNQNRNGLARKLRIEVADGPNGEKRRGIIRQEFVVPKD